MQFLGVLGDNKILRMIDENAIPSSHPKPPYSARSSMPNGNRISSAKNHASERAVDLTRFRRRCWGERKKEESQCREPIHHMRRSIGAGSSNWRGPGRSINELAQEFEASANAIRQWIKQAALDEGLRSDGLTTSEHEELNRLRRENRVLREEREIVSKAVAWFAQETGATPSRRSNS